MPATPHSFKRLVLGLQPSAPDRSMQFAVKLADLLHLELLGLFLEDTSLHDLAAMPFARELRGLGGGWQPIDLERLSRDLERAARNLERMFTQAAKDLATRSRFEVARGRMAESIASVSRTDDIVMVVVPPSAAERATQQFSWLTEAAFRSAAAVILVPPQIVRTSGPVVAIAATPDDPSIRAAAAVALAAKEELVVIAADHHGVNEAALRRLAEETGLTVAQLAAAKGVLPDPAACAQAFRHVRERLVVMSRGAFDDAVASTIAVARQVPVLVIEPRNLPAGEAVGTGQPDSSAS